MSQPLTFSALFSYETGLLYPYLYRGEWCVGRGAPTTLLCSQKKTRRRQNGRNRGPDPFNAKAPGR